MRLYNGSYLGGTPNFLGSRTTLPTICLRTVQVVNFIVYYSDRNANSVWLLNKSITPRQEDRGTHTWMDLENVTLGERSHAAWGSIYSKSLEQGLPRGRAD